MSTTAPVWSCIQRQRFQAAFNIYQATLWKDRGWFRCLLPLGLSSITWKAVGTEAAAPSY